MASKYERVNPWEEKLKRLYNCNKMTKDDQKYLNYHFERYKLRGFHIVSADLVCLFALTLIPQIKSSTPFKYYSSLAVFAYSFWKFFTYLSNRHYEQIISPYFEKYKVK